MNATAEAEPPAAAYPLVAELLGDAYFAEPPPALGIEVIVRGPDRINTTWRMSTSAAQALYARVAHDARLAWVLAQPYEPTNEPPHPETIT